MNDDWPFEHGDFPVCKALKIAVTAVNPTASTTSTTSRIASRMKKILEMDRNGQLVSSSSDTIYNTITIIYSEYNMDSWKMVIFHFASYSLVINNGIDMDTITIT